MLQLPKKSLNQPATLKVLLKTPKSIFITVWFDSCDLYLRRGALGPIRKRKTVGKIIQNRKTEKRFDQNRKPHAKLSKPMHFHIQVIKTLIDPIQW